MGVLHVSLLRRGFYTIEANPSKAPLLAKQIKSGPKSQVALARMIGLVATAAFVRKGKKAVRN